MIIQKFANSRELHAWGESCCFCLYVGTIARRIAPEGERLLRVGEDLSLLRIEHCDETFPILVRTSLLFLFIRFLEVLPILSIFVGVGRMCAVWGVEDTKDSICLKIYHTLVAILDILGLGILILALTILLNILYAPCVCFFRKRTWHW
ncbi:hypothetical protein C10C_0800 [Chlamydia serpentis]|uniref:Uncharacterized protein n=1 Tax=Chlamydia serpentis TaxID=1967782 RepID=A0A2R8FC13_9CHLA|nr:hypothetical protein [Chlamydia serpentis]SPN73943.1 hypothetical protein C10C_0800 [Chlamydia serpentis]